MNDQADLIQKIREVFPRYHDWLEDSRETWGINNLEQWYRVIGNSRDILTHYFEIGDFVLFLSKGSVPGAAIYLGVPYRRDSNNPWAEIQYVWHEDVEKINFEP